MQYLDKSSNRIVSLSESRTNFLVLAEPSDSESVAPLLLNQKVFTVTPSTNNDGVFVFEARSEQESSAEIDRAVSNLRSDQRIKAVVPALLDDNGEVRFALPGRVVVRFKGLKDAAVKKYLASINSAIVTAYGAGLYEVAVPEGVELGYFIATLNENPDVLFAEPSFYGFSDQEVRVQVDTPTPRIRIDVAPLPDNPPPEGEPDDEPDGEVPPDAENLAWNLKKLSAAKAWTLTTGSKEIIVAIVDGRPDTEHEAINKKFFVDLTGELVFTADDSVSSHATQICGIVCGESDKLSGVARDARVLPLIVNLNSQAYAERASAILRAAEFARQKKIGKQPFARMILSCSWKTRGDIAAIRTSLEEAVEAGILVVFSAGNDGVNAPHFPSDYSRRAGVLQSGVMSVAAIDIQDAKAGYSNFSASVDVCAPGGDGLPLDEGDIFCADQGGGYNFGAGTSLAAPHVAAVAALMLSLNPALSPADLKRILIETADDISLLNPAYQNLLGSGRINAYKALLAVSAAAEPENDNSTGDISTIEERLRQYSGELEDETGWSLATVLVVKGETSAEIDLS